jgi:hypothetical protein
MRYKSTLIVLALILSTLTACGGEDKKQTDNPAENQSSKTEKTTEPTKNDDKKPAPSGNDIANGITQLKGYLTEIDTAVKSKDFAKAEKIYKDYDETWEKIENKIKAKSKTGYTEIEEATDKVKKELKAKDDKKASGAIATLVKTIDKNQPTLTK